MYQYAVDDESTIGHVKTFDGRRKESCNYICKYIDIKIFILVHTRRWRLKTGCIVPPDKWTGADEPSMRSPAAEDASELLLVQWMRIVLLKICSRNTWSSHDVTYVDVPSAFSGFMGLSITHCQTNVYNYICKYRYIYIYLLHTWRWRLNLSPTTDSIRRFLLIKILWRPIRLKERPLLAYDLWSLSLC